MRTDIIFTLSRPPDWQDLKLTMSDNTGQLCQVLPASQQVVLTSKILLPNTIRLDIYGQTSNQSNKVILRAMTLGSLAVPVSTLDQICQFHPIHSQQLITRHWWCIGHVIIDLFANDWVQWHLAYGHKIEP